MAHVDIWVFGYDIRPINLEEYGISMKTWKPALQWGHSPNELPPGDLSSDRKREDTKSQPFICAIPLPAVPRRIQADMKVPKTREQNQVLFWLRRGQTEVTSMRAHQYTQGRSSCPVRRSWGCELLQPGGVTFGWLKQQPAVPTGTFSRRWQETLNSDGLLEGKTAGINWNKKGSRWI